jgi:hypothetical protein
MIVAFSQVPRRVYKTPELPQGSDHRGHQEGWRIQVQQISDDLQRTSVPHWEISQEISPQIL